MTTKALNYTTAEINQRLNLAGTAVQPNALNDYYTKTVVDSMVVVDLSVRYATSYANLAAALVALNSDTAADATAIKKGGVSIKFINSTTNKYEQWNLKASSWSTNTSDWELDVDGSVTNGKFKLPFELKRPNAGTPVTNATEIDYGTGENKQPLNTVIEGMPSVAPNQTGAPELEITDENGNAVVQFPNGEIVSKNFNSANTPKQENSLHNDLEFTDEQGNAIMKLANGEVETKYFNSRKTPNIDNAAASDLEISDEQGNIIVSFQNGHIKTKNFDSSNIEPAPSPSTGFLLVKVY